MNSEQRKVADNTSSAYLSLKAELLRKQQDAQPASMTSASSSAILDHLQSTSSSLKLKTKAELDVEVANPSKKKKPKTDEAPPSSSSTAASALTREEEVAFAKSRAILEAKAKLYDQIMSNNDMKLLAEDDGDDDNDKSFLVDFERKIYETNEPKKQVEYIDSFGRTRLVTPDEYERLMAAQPKRSEPRTPPRPTTEEEIRRAERLHREQMRSKWEADMDALRNKAEVHYEDVLFDEKRDHGVGYYRFSTDDEKRAEQMATLNELRTKTKTEQMKFVQEKERRQSSMADRLNKIRLRKAKEMGIDLSGEGRAENTDASTIEPELPEPTMPTRTTPEEKPVESPIPQPEIKPKPIDPSEVVPPPRPPPPPPKPAPNPSSLAYPFPIMRTQPSS